MASKKLNYFDDISDTLIGVMQYEKFDLGAALQVEQTKLELINKDLPQEHNIPQPMEEKSDYVIFYKN